MRLCEAIPGVQTISAVALRHDTLMACMCCVYREWARSMTMHELYDSQRCEPITDSLFFRSGFCRFFKTRKLPFFYCSVHLRKKRPKPTDIFGFSPDKSRSASASVCSLFYIKPKPTGFFGEKPKADRGHFHFRFTTLNHWHSISTPCTIYTR